MVSRRDIFFKKKSETGPLMCCKDLTRDVLLILNFSGFFLIKVSTSLKDKKVHMFFNNHDYTLDFVLFIVSTLKYEHKNNTEKPTFY